MNYMFLEPGEEVDGLLKTKIIDKKLDRKRKPHPELGNRYSTDRQANHELIACVGDHGFDFQETTRRSAGPFTSKFVRDGKEFIGEAATQLMANCIAALCVANYLHSLTGISN